MQIKTKDLTHIFDKGGFSEFQALDGVTTKITQGEFITIIGQTGSGKTTFIEHLNALLLPTNGEVVIGNKIIKNTKRKIRKIKELRKQVGIVFQFAEYQLFEETIQKDIIFGPITMGSSKEAAIKKAKKYIKLVGMDESFLDKSPFALSGGQKRRIALAGILAMEPNILIFDEPTAGLDPQGEIEMYKIFKKLHKEGKTIIIVTHNLDHALQHSKRTLLFKDGKLIKDGETIEILYDKKLLEDNELETPKLVTLVETLEGKKLEIGRPRSIKELINIINKKRK